MLCQVVLVNPRGSSGYGQAISDGCVQDWGGGDYYDLLAGLDAALALHPWLDGGRVGVCGGSCERQSHNNPVRIAEHKLCCLSQTDIKDVSDGGFMSMWMVRFLSSPLSASTASPPGKPRRAKCARSVVAAPFPGDPARSAVPSSGRPRRPLESHLVLRFESSGPALWQSPSVWLDSQLVVRSVF